MKTYVSELNRFYEGRKYLHFIVTPVLFVSYIFGFSMLLPLFEKEFSYGFYNYILFSSGIVFLVLAVFIGFHIYKELRGIRELRDFG